MNIAALICTILSGIGCIVILTDTSPIQECLPPTVLLAIGATVCWALSGKKKQKKLAYQAEPNNKGKTAKAEGWKREELWEDYPFPDYDKRHTYCSIEMDADGKILYYRTRNPELKVGDKVYVPVGSAYEKKTGKIIRMEDVCGENIPYPLEKTRFVIGKA